MSGWLPFPPGAQALVPPGFIVSQCATCGRGTVDAVGGMDALTLRQDNLTVHGWMHAEGCVEPITGDPSWRDLMVNVADALDVAAREAIHPVARIRGIRQARSLRWPSWIAWLWKVLPE